jgi:hypothetical protein
MMRHIVPQTTVEPLPYGNHGEDHREQAGYRGEFWFIVPPSDSNAFPTGYLDKVISRISKPFLEPHSNNSFQVPLNLPMFLWHHKYISEDEKKSMAGLLHKAVERFRDELESSLVVHLGYM